MKTVVYTAIYDGKDELEEVSENIVRQSQNELVEWICFTDDSSIASNTWNVIYLSRFDPDPVLSARYPKMMIHELIADVERSVWIDGRTIIKAPLWKLFDSIRDDFAAFVHYSRDCAYDEVAACMKQAKDYPHRLTGALQKLVSSDHPKHSGLWMTGCLFRRHTPAVNELCSLWWSMVQDYSRRDQITLPLAINRLQIPVTTLSQPLLKRTIKFGSHAR